MTLQELVDRALSIASIGLDQSVAQLLTNEVVAEDLLLQVFAEVGEQAARDERQRHLLRRTKDLAVVNGTVALPGDALSMYIEDSVLIDPTDITKRYSYLAWEHFVRSPLDSRLGHYSVVGEMALEVVEPDTEYNPTSGPTINLQLSIPCVPEVPASVGDDIAVSAEVADVLVERLAVALKPIIQAREKR